MQDLKTGQSQGEVSSVETSTEVLQLTDSQKFDVLKKGVSRMRDYDLEKTDAVFSQMSDAELNQQHGQSGSTRREILESHIMHREKVDAAENFLNRLQSGETERISRVTADRYFEVIEVGLSKLQDNELLRMAEISFSGMTKAELNEEHGQTGRTRQEVLDRYRAENAEIESVKQFLAKLQYQVYNE